MEIKDLIEDKIKQINGQARVNNIFSLSTHVLNNTESIRLKKLYNFGYFLGALNNSHTKQDEYLQTLKHITDNYLEKTDIMGKFYGFLGIGASNVDIVDGIYKNNVIINFELSGKEVYLGIFELLKLTINQLVFRKENINNENEDIDDYLIEETMEFIKNRILVTLNSYVNDCLRIEIDKFKYGNMEDTFVSNNQ